MQTKYPDKKVCAIPYFFGKGSLDVNVVFVPSLVKGL